MDDNPPLIPPPSLAHLEPEAYLIAEELCPALAMMMERYSTATDLCAALGYKSASSFHGFLRDRGLTDQTMLRAKAWLEREAEAELAKAEAFFEDKPAPETELLIVTCPPEQAAKARRVLEALGCTVESA